MAIFKRQVSDAVYTCDAASQFKTGTKGTQTVTLNYDVVRGLVKIKVDLPCPGTGQRQYSAPNMAT